MKAVLSCILVLAACRTCSAGTGAFGAPLGSAPVGYRVAWIRDPSRSWQAPDSSGHLHRLPRMVRVHTWYPAVRGTGAGMTLGDYMAPTQAPGVPAQLVDLIRTNDFGDTSRSFRGIYRSDQAAFERAMRTRVAARGGATPAPGKCPVVVYAVGQNDWTQDAVSLAEFLASNGFIVTTVPHLGTSARRPLLFVHDPLSYETQLRDLEVALGRALALPNADGNRVVAMGHSYGGIYALLLAMRSGVVRGVIGLDPTYIAKRAGFEYDLRRFPYFDADIRVPIATLRRSSDVDRSLLDSFHRAERLEIVYPQLLHGDFTTVAFLRRDLPDALQRPDEIGLRSPQLAAAGATAAFAEALDCCRRMVAGQALAEHVVDSEGVTTNVSHSAAAGAPTHDELYWIYRSRGRLAAEDSLRAARSNAPSAELYSESRLLTAARELGYLDRQAESLDMFRLAAHAFPDSVSAQVATARALLDAGLREEAKVLLIAALRLDPANKEAQEALVKATSP